jgi:hypothetical protein
MTDYSFTSTPTALATDGKLSRRKHSAISRFIRGTSAGPPYARPVYSCTKLAPGKSHIQIVRTTIVISHLLIVLIFTSVTDVTGIVNCQYSSVEHCRLTTDLQHERWAAISQARVQLHQAGPWEIRDTCRQGNDYYITVADNSTVTSVTNVTGMANCRYVALERCKSDIDRRHERWAAVSQARVQLNQVGSWGVSHKDLLQIRLVLYDIVCDVNYT